MRRMERVVARTPEDLAEVMGLSAAEAQEWRAQYALLETLRRKVEQESWTEAELAKRVGCSRGRVTAILNGNLDGVEREELMGLLSGVEKTPEPRRR